MACSWLKDSGLAKLIRSCLWESNVQVVKAEGLRVLQ